MAPRWIEEGLCFYIPYKLIERKREKLSEFALETDRILFEALKQLFSERDHWLYEFYNFDTKYSKAGEEFKGPLDNWDCSTSVMAVYELSNATKKNSKELINAISNAYKDVSETLNKVKANREFMEKLFIELGIQDATVNDFCLRFRICPPINE